MKSILRVVFFLLWSSWGLCAQTIDTDSYFQTAFNWMQLEEYEKSLQAYEHAFSLEDSRNIYAANCYNAACAAALSNDKETAFFYLRKALKRGYLDVENLRSDQDLSSLHQDPRWGQYVDEMEAKLERYAEVKCDMKDG
jgi:tetratricopeptide (TPR) repeat protein